MISKLKQKMFKLKQYFFNINLLYDKNLKAPIKSLASINSRYSNKYARDYE